VPRLPAPTEADREGARRFLERLEEIEEERRVEGEEEVVRSGRSEESEESKEIEESVEERESEEDIEEEFEEEFNLLERAIAAEQSAVLSARLVRSELVNRVQAWRLDVEIAWLDAELERYRERAELVAKVEAWMEGWW
jgi:hypothetical protein